MDNDLKFEVANILKTYFISENKTEDKINKWLENWNLNSTNLEQFSYDENFDRTKYRENPCRTFFYILIRNIILPEDILLKLLPYFDRTLCEQVVWYQKVGDKALIELFSRCDNLNIFRCQRISEKFIRENFDKLGHYWAKISKYGVNLSEDFIREYKDKIQWWFVVGHQKVSPEFKKEFADKYENEQYKNRISWLYETDEFKINHIKFNYKNEILEDSDGKYIIAYKIIRKNRMSAYTAKCIYLKNHVYEDSNCDCTPYVDLVGGSSYGIHGYMNVPDLYKPETEICVRVKIYIKDIGIILDEDVDYNKNIIHKFGIFRCYKLKFLD